MEDYYGATYAKVSGSYSGSGGVTITVTGAGTSSAYIFTVGDVIMNAKTRERMLVATIASSTTITVASGGRSLGTTAAAAGQDGDGLYKIGSASEENSTSRNVNTTRTSKRQNACQIFRRTISISESEQASKHYGGNELDRHRGKEGTIFGEEIDKAFMFGEVNLTFTGSNSKPERLTGGILEFIESNNAYVQDQNGVLTAPDLEVFLREGYTHGNKKKVLMCGGLLLSTINEMAQGSLRTAPGEKTFGLSISAWQNTWGITNLLFNPTLVQDFGGYGFLLDLDSFEYRYLEGNGKNRDVKLLTERQANDADGIIEEYLAEVGLGRHLPGQNAMIKNITG